MQLEGYLRKMKAEQGEEVQYAWVLDHTEHPLNPHIGDSIEIEFLDDIQCMACHKSTGKSYNQGYCYHCFKTLARNDHCIMAPEHCHYDLGTCREPEWGLKHCMQPHVVYVAWTSGFKVGLTRFHQQMNRWMDQGATHAMAVCQVNTRKQAGLLEDHLRTWYKDRTEWKAMLNIGYDDQIDLLPQKEKMLEELRDFEMIPLEDPMVSFQYPVHAMGVLKALTLDKQRKISGHLLGIKGQYLILDTGVVNVRRHGSYKVRLTIRSS